MNQILNTFMSKTKGFQSYDGESEEHAALRKYTEATTFRGRKEPYHAYPYRIDDDANDMF